MIIALPVSLLSVVVEIQPPSPTIMSDSDILTSCIKAPKDIDATKVHALVNEMYLK